MMPSAYSVEFSKIAFKTRLPGPLAEIASRLGVPRTEDSSDFISMHNVYPIRSASRPRYIVKYFIARAQHIFGIFYDVETAARLADMIILKFAHLRQNKRKTPTDESFNFTLAQAQRDLANEGEINSLLTQFLSSLDENLLQRRTPKPRSTARSEFHSVKEEIIEHIIRLNRKLDDAVKKIDVLADRMRSILPQPRTLLPGYLGDPTVASPHGLDLPISPIFGGANTCCEGLTGDGSVFPQ